MKYGCDILDILIVRPEVNYFGVFLLIHNALGNFISMLLLVYDTSCMGYLYLQFCHVLDFFKMFHPSSIRG